MAHDGTDPDSMQSLSVSGNNNPIKRVKQTQKVNRITKILMYPPQQVQFAAPTPPQQPYELKPWLTLPATKNRLAIASFMLTIVMAIEGFAGLRPIVRWVTRHQDATKSLPSSVWAHMIACLIALALVIVLLGLRCIVKEQLRKVSRFSVLPGLIGINDRLVIGKFKGYCSCGGKLRFYNQPAEWIDKTYSDGHTKREVTKRRQVAECRRNPDHISLIDQAETIVERDDASTYWAST